MAGATTPAFFFGLGLWLKPSGETRPCWSSCRRPGHGAWLQVNVHQWLLPMVHRAHCAIWLVWLV
jgi:hypothetical protein